MKTSILVSLFIGFFCISALSSDIQPQWPVVSNIQVSQTINFVSITWSANAEEKDMFYVIEKRTNGEQYKTAAVVLMGMESNQNFCYCFREKLNSFKTSYRIKQVKQDGSFQIVAERTL